MQLEPRPIETVDDVRHVLESRAASFLELMSCVAVARTAGDWQLRHQAAERAFNETKVASPHATVNLSQAAEVAGARELFAKRAGSLEELPMVSAAAQKWLASSRAKLHKAGATATADEQAELLTELQVLLSDKQRGGEGQAVLPSPKGRTC